MVMRDVACAGYVAGGNVRFFANDDMGNYTVDACNQNLMSRLAFDDDVTDKYASMLAFPAHEGQFKGGQLDTCMSVTTRLLPWEVSATSTHDSFPGGNAMFEAYQGVLNLKQIHYGEDMKAAGSRRRLKPCPLATLADRPPACVPLQRTRISSPKARLTYAQATQPTCLACCSLLTRALPSPVTRTQPAFLAPAAATIRSRARSCRSCRARATSAPTPSPATRAGVAARACRSRRPATAWSRSSALPCLSNPRLALSRGPRLTRHPFLVQAGPARADGVLGALSERRACRSSLHQEPHQEHHQTPPRVETNGGDHAGDDNDCDSTVLCFRRARVCVCVRACVCSCAAQGDQIHRIRNPSGGGITFSSAC